MKVLRHWEGDDGHMRLEVEDARGQVRVMAARPLMGVQARATMVVLMKCPHCRKDYDAGDEMAREWHSTAECAVDAAKEPLDRTAPRLPDEGSPREVMRKERERK